MKIYLDTEFIERPNTIELISIGLIREDGKEYYAISSEFNPDNASLWVKENVLDILEADVPRKSIETIRNEILAFTDDLKKEKIEFWGYFPSYDWVVFCWIFGTMEKLPANYPKYCLDLKQEMHKMGVKRHTLPSHDAVKHNALEDAKWHKKVFDFLFPSN